MDATVAMDALARAHRDLDRPQDGLPTAPTGHRFVNPIQPGGGGIFDDRRWGILNDR